MASTAATTEVKPFSAQAKGAGMIEPGYATMLCFVQTDGVVENAEALASLRILGSFPSLEGGANARCGKSLEAKSGQPLSLV